MLNATSLILSSLTIATQFLPSHNLSGDTPGLLQKSFTKISEDQFSSVT